MKNIPHLTFWYTLCASLQYRKPTACKFALPFEEFSPDEWKHNRLRFFLRRGITHTSDQKLMHQEFELIEKMFKKSGWPTNKIKNAIRNTVDRFYNIKFSMKNKNDEPENPEKDDLNKTVHENDLPTEDEKPRVPLFLPWCGTAAHRHVIRLRQTIPRDYCKVTIAYRSQKFHSLLLRYTSCTDDLETKYLASDLVYKYECDCGQLYIGETLRRLSIRIKEHQKDKDSAIFRHVQSCKWLNCFGLPKTVEKDKFTIVKRGLRHKEARKRFETFFIKFYNKKSTTSTMNGNDASRELAIY